MQLKKVSLLLALSVSIVASCENDNVTPLEKKNEQNKKEATLNTEIGSDTQSNTTVSKELDRSMYLSNSTKGTIENNDSTFKWNFDNMIVTTTKVKSKEVGPDSEYLSDVIISNGVQSYTLAFKYKVKQIQSISLSTDKKLLAISFNYGPGSNVQIINLESGAVKDLNSELENDGAGFIESIQAYNWSPRNHDLAFAFGDTSSSKIGIYHADDNSFTFPSSDDSYISTQFVLWHKDGKMVDYVIENPSDQFTLYRYDIRNNKTDDVLSLSREELRKLVDYAPAVLDN